MPTRSGASDDTSWARRRGIVFSTHRGELLLEHHDEQLTDGRLDLAIIAKSAAQKTQDTYCTICCTIPNTDGLTRRIISNFYDST